MSVADRPGRAADRRVAGRLLVGIEEGLGLSFRRDPSEVGLLERATEQVRAATRGGPGLLSALGRPAGDAGAALARAAAALEGRLGEPEAVLAVLREHLADVPDAARPDVGGEASISLASFQHLTAAVAGALAGGGGLAVLTLRLRGLLDHLYRPGRVAPVDLRAHLEGRALHLHLLLRAAAAHLVRRLEATRVQILAVDAEGCLVLSAGDALAGPVVAGLEDRLNRWLLDEYAGRLRLAVDAMDLGEGGLAGFGLALRRIEARHEDRARRPFRRLLPEIFRAPDPVPAIVCSDCGRPDPGPACPRCEAFTALGRKGGRAPAGFRIELDDEPAEGVADPLVAFAPLAAYARLEEAAAPVADGDDDQPMVASGFLLVRVKDVVGLFAGGQRPSSLGHFLDADATIRSWLGIDRPRAFEEAAGPGRVAWFASARRLVVVGPWDRLVDLAEEAIGALEALPGPPVPVAAALVDLAGPADLPRAVRAARTALARAARTGQRTIDALGRTRSWSGSEPDALRPLVETGRALATALRAGCDPSFVTWLGALGARYRIGRPDEDRMWEPALHARAVRALRDRRHAGLRRLLLADTRERSLRIAHLDLPVRYAHLSRKR